MPLWLRIFLMGVQASMWRQGSEGEGGGGGVPSIPPWGVLLPGTPFSIGVSTKLRQELRSSCSC